MNVEIERFEPDSGRSWVDIFQVPETDCRRMTVMDVLEYISLNLDPTLAYYHHSVCDHGICGRCALGVNGKTVLACLAVANDYETLRLTPAPGRQVVRDLVTRPR